ncbi:hypothetical protein LY474_17620 [Myxococcus stipitatus]|uniref:hypothetical protein n=1 Tax=Myxococcus stipitatus TaxID=83455 RepID=UPI001F2029A4|nr:hypothetical protein [Myxococcus stipitatus]MCE9669617.1 hypothetical protein [Myxococcus stipitatus]
MRFALDIGRRQELPGLQVRDDEELDDVRSILADVCAALSEVGAVDFVASGFGQARWPVDVGTDLPVFLEQLPEALDALDAGREFTLDFYEQGLERTLRFQPVAGGYRVRCESHTAWKPAPEVEVIESRGLRTMLVDVRSRFMEVLAAAAPQVAAHAWVRAWAGEA